MATVFSTHNTNCFVNAVPNIYLLRHCHLRPLDHLYVQWQRLHCKRMVHLKLLQQPKQLSATQRLPLWQEILRMVRSKSVCGFSSILQGHCAWRAEYEAKEGVTKIASFILKACGCVGQHQSFARIKMRRLERKIELLKKLKVDWSSTRSSLPSWIAFWIIPLSAGVVLELISQAIEMRRHIMVCICKGHLGVQLL